ncbi:MAG TPA: response regulator [Chitinophagaceae bacterium]|nr:response regulator [Chitinophagaceae bacterium]
MNKNGPVIIIEDDEDDLELLKDVFKELDYPNEIKFFLNGVDAFNHLEKTDERPFLILSDINLPKLSGFDLRDKIHNNEDLKLKCIPYLFFTTATDQRSVIDAYSKSIQGFFTKPSSTEDLKRVIRNIMEYWKDCHSPNFMTS